MFQDVEFINADILRIDALDVIVHQVNCKGVMGAGLAKQIKDKYPEVYEEYVRRCQETENPSDLLGQIDCVQICHDIARRKSCSLENRRLVTTDNKVVVNFYSQCDYGRNSRKVYTDYKAFNKCLNKLRIYLEDKPVSLTIAFPDHIGCGLANGNWNIIKDLIINFSYYIRQSVCIVKKYDKYKRS